MKSDKHNRSHKPKNPDGHKEVMRVERLSNPLETAVEAGAHLSDILTLYTDKPLLLLIAGGSSLSVLEHINPAHLGPHITVTVTDDRFSDELDENNFATLQSTSFYNALIGVDSFCIDTQISGGESLEEYRARFERNLREWKADFPRGVVVALYGMGEDGHTAGMIPGFLDEAAFEKEFNTDSRLVGAIDMTKSKKPHPLRISTTLPFMRDYVDHAVFYITGENKAGAFAKALSGKTPYFEIPASVMTRMKDAVVFTDIK